jgi:sulfate adenylyltransferase
MRLADGTFFPIPLTLNAARLDGLSEGVRVALRSPRNNILAWMEIEEVFDVDVEAEAAEICGAGAHPFATELKTWGRYALSGTPQGVEPRRCLDFSDLRRTPAQTRSALAALGRSRVVAFEAPHPPHRGEEAAMIATASTLDASLLLDPVSGLTETSGADHFARIRAYRALAERCLDPRRSLLTLVPFARRAGARDLLLQAIVRRNFGASHMIVPAHAATQPVNGNGHGHGHGNGNGHGHLKAEATLAGAAEIGVEMILAPVMAYLPDEGRYEELHRCNGARNVFPISTAEIESRYVHRGQRPPAWMVRPEVAEVVYRASPARTEQGFCLWFTGLPSAGKSTIAEIVAAMLQERGRRVTLLDGDVVRTHLSRGLGFSREDRDTNIVRIGFVASEIVRHHGVVICAAVSPYRATRARVREMVGDSHFIEVFVDTPQVECERRDVKGYYARARAGELPGFTGVDDPYEAPLSPELRLETTSGSKEQIAGHVVDYLIARGYLASEDTAAAALQEMALFPGAD